MDPAEWRRLQTCATSLSPLLAGDVRNFVIEPYGKEASQGAVTWIRAVILGNQDGKADAVALKLRTSDWVAVRGSCCPLKAIQARLCDEAPYPVLDLTGPDAVLITAVCVAGGEQLQIAEVFCGGFSGFSQAASILHAARLPAHIAWKLDWDPLVQPYLRAQCPDLMVVASRDALDMVQPEDAVLLQANAADTWWMSMFSRRPTNAIALSAPCPPWSGAGRSRGLHTAEGRLMIRLADVCGCLGIPVVIIEQVASFQRHEHFPTVLQAWKEAGYTWRFQQTLDLLDLLPCSRSRFIAVLVHASVLEVGSLPLEAWCSQKRTTLGKAEAIMPLPREILHSLLLSGPVMDMYLDPALLPNPRGRAQVQAPAQYRIRGGGGFASCFMARYTQQHELPWELLSQKGLLGCLLNDGDHVRFFSSAEIASLHGLHETLWIGQDLAANMQIVGNSISVPHAITGLLYALRAVKLDKGLTLAEATQLVLADRLHAGNSVFLPAKEGWLFCSRMRLQSRLAQSLPSLAVAPPRLGQLGLQEVVLLMADAHTSLHVDHGVDIGLLARYLGVTPPVLNKASLQQGWQVDSLPSVSHQGTHNGGEVCKHLVTVLAEGCTFVLHADSTLSCVQQLEVCLRVAQPPVGSCAFYSVEGKRLQPPAPLPPVSLAVFEHEDVPNAAFQLTEPELLSLHLRVEKVGFTWEASAHNAALFQLTFPTHLLTPLGWSLRRLPPSEPLPPTPPPACCTAGLDSAVANGATSLVCNGQGPARSSALVLAATSPVHFSLLPLAPCPAMSHSQLHLLQRVWLLRARLEELQATASATLCVEVAITNNLIWSGRLPPQTTLQTLELAWHQVSSTAQLPPAGRIFSGPFPHPPAATLEALHVAPSGVLRNRVTGRLVVTVHPELVGGGAKSDAKSWATSKVATACMKQGIELAAAATFAEALAPNLPTKDSRQHSDLSRVPRYGKPSQLLQPRWKYLCPLLIHSTWWRKPGQASQICQEAATSAECCCR